MSDIWSLEYSPENIDDFEIIQPDAYQILTGYIQKRNFPHLLLTGSEGVGKTSLARVFAQKFITEKYNLKMVYVTDPIAEEDVDDSEDATTNGKGVTSLINRIKQFVDTPVVGDDPFKIIIIRDFDKLNLEQNAMRRIMEKSANTCRMILIATKISRVIDPIISRSPPIRLHQLSDDAFDDILSEILEEVTNSNPPENVITNLRILSEKNIGKALNIAQTAYQKTRTLSVNTIRNEGHNYIQKIASDMLQSLSVGKLELTLRLIDKSISTYFDWHDFLTVLTRSILTFTINPSIKKCLIRELAKSETKSDCRREIRFHLYNLATNLFQIFEQYKVKK